jgi:hypothetical protein
VDWSKQAARHHADKTIETVNRQQDKTLTAWRPKAITIVLVL